MEYSRKQENAIQAVKRWHDGGGRETFRMFGFAGSGKTTLAKHFAEGIDGTVMYAAFTGKAALVLQQKGCTGATTIHKLIYKPAEKSKETLNQLRKELNDHTTQMQAEGCSQEEIDADPRVIKIHQALEIEKAKHKRLSFVINEESPLKGAKLLVVDEVSMVDGIIGRDLEEFGVPLLVLGDPAQLPPVMGTGYFTNQKPDVLLDEVHRQAAGNPVLRMATDVREGRSLRLGEFGESKVIKKSDVNRDEVMAFDQVLCGTNKMRQGLNNRIRELLGRTDPMPLTGDRVVCLRNNHEIGILNGGLFDVESSMLVGADNADMAIREVGSDFKVQLSTHTQFFVGKEPPFWAIKEHECFDYGNALTVHKAQGSQWNSVFIFDESRCFRVDARKWLYTALTRAAKKVTIVQD